MIAARWSGYLGGVALRREASRRITTVAIVGTLLVFGVALLQRWPARPLIAMFLVVQASQIIARIYLAHEAAVSVVVADAGLALVHKGEVLWFVQWEDVSVATNDGRDVCIATCDGAFVRVGMDSDNETALRAIRAALASRRARLRARARSPRSPGCRRRARRRGP